MAAASSAQIFPNNNNNHEVSRQEIQAAIAKAVELRALHAALTQGNSPANLRFPTSASPSVSRPSSQFSARDYPVFTPSYEDEPLPGYHLLQLENQTLPEYWDRCGLEGGDEDEANHCDYRKETSSSRKDLPSSLISREPPHICSADQDHKSPTSSCANHITVLQTSPGTDFFKSVSRTGSGDFKSVTSCNQCRPAIIRTESDNGTKNSKNSNTVVPLTDSHISVHSQPKTRGPILSWFFPRLKQKHKNETSQNRAESEVSQIFKDFGIMSLESLRKELIEANKNKETALMEVAEMKSSMGDLKLKLEHLESYCEELRKALKQTVQGNDVQVPEWSGNLPKRGKSIDANRNSSMPINHDAMAEGFLQIVSEARLSVKQFCKTLVGQIEETDSNLMEKLILLQPYKPGLNSKYSKKVLYHLEALINQSLYQDFENCVFQKNGSPKILDPQQDRQAQFSSYVALRNLSWNEVLRKGTKYYSEEFSRFCDQKMSCIISTLNWTRQWPEQLLQSFFVTTKCIWLLHLLAFSFNPPLGILRVEENRNFNSLYMEDIMVGQQRSQAPTLVKIMVTPGFYVHDSVLRCKVLCR
ncbi:hypothetical protein HHK36_019833 [Tetracentron sinense]|uniref:GIL1/IRKI C-terminal domain-containing protein n=1 Tax=Tetracentron sinense TaxID=13715 RepID=A0A835D9Y7_TETSI|nr:hypothetical protein HHK36_019833 [Tetracentron sinense]